MNIRIQVRHEAASERIQKYITNEFEHVISRFSENGVKSTDSENHPYVVSAEFVVDQEGSNGHLKTFEAIIHVPGDTITVKERDPEANKAIDVAMKVIEKLLKRHKETHLKPGTQIRHNIERHATTE
jgi:ribosome-associated translation inhibitor RaiA